MSENRVKEGLGKAAAEMISDGATVGLGSGSTAACFIQSLSKRCRAGLKITAVATSKDSERLAQLGGIPLIPLDSIDTLDVVVDGADEVDREKRMIKGGGGALLREKIIATMGKKRIIIIEKKKYVDKLGHFPLPVEIVPFGHKATLRQIEAHGYKGRWRYKTSNIMYKTDNGNYILDLTLNKFCQDPEKDHQLLKMICGVVETGFFFNLADSVVIGDDQGNINII